MSHELTYFQNRPRYASDRAGVCRKHQQGVMGWIVMLEIRRDAVVERVRDVVLGVGPLVRVHLSFLESLREDLPYAIFLLLQASSRRMGDPVRQDEVQRIADISLHLMQQPIELLAVFGVEVGTHQALHDDCVDQDRDVLEEIHVWFLRPFRKVGSRCIVHDFGIVIKGRFAIDATA